MKKLILLTILSLIAFAGKAQDDIISKYFSEYENRDDFTTIIITSRMFGLIAQIPESEDEEDMMNIIRKLTGLKILTSDEYPDKAELYKKAYKLISQKGYDDLMVVKEGNEEIKFLINENDGKISEFVMLVGGNDSFLLMSLAGNLNLHDISRLSKTMDIEGFEHLEKIDDK